MEEQIFYYRELKYATTLQIKATSKEKALEKLQKIFGEKLSGLLEVWTRKDGVKTSVWSLPN